ncbi:MAG: glycosyltransferase family 2 protein [Kiritimatiellae bacterium]|nr:glycosyltransferase family 2 protein [Kiritimatiellia bacterium]
MKLSVVIPVNNGAGCLGRCLESILASSAAADGSVALELLVVDDASTDATPCVVERFRQRLPGVVVVRHEANLGVGEARNAGLRRATGEWVAWVDADDEVEPEWFSRMTQTLQTGDPDVLAFDATAVWDGGGGRYPVVYGRSAGLVDARRFALDVMGASVAGARLWNRVFRRRLIEGLEFGGRSFEDYRFQVEALKRARSVLYLPERLYIYHRGANGLSQYVEPKQCLEALLALARDADAEPDADFHRAQVRGVAIMAADFLRHADLSGLPDAACLRRWVRRAWPILMREPDVGWRLRAKAFLAGMGL